MTNISLRGLAKKYNIPYATVNARSNKEKWASQKQETQNKIIAEVEQKTAEAVIEKKVETNKKHIILFDVALNIIEHILDSYIQELSQGYKKTKASAYTIDAIMSAILKAQKGQRLALNIDSEDVEDIEPEIAIIEGVDLDKI